MTADSGADDRRARRTFRQRVSGIRVRVVVGYVGVFTIALGLALILTRQLLLDQVMNNTDERLSQESQELRRFASQGLHPTTGEPFTDRQVEVMLETFMVNNVPDTHEMFYAFVGERWVSASHNADRAVLDDRDLVRAWTSAQTPQRATYDTALGEIRSLAVPLIDGNGEVTATFVAVYFPGDDRHEALETVRLLLVTGLVVLVISGVVAWSLAGRVLRPIAALTRTAQRISHSDLSARIPIRGDDELAELGRTFNEMIERLEAGFQHQRQFLDDVAHELRTPITIARGHLDTIGDTPEERDEAVAIVADELDRMARYVSDLLVLAKAGHPDFLRLSPVDLGELANTVFQRVEPLGNRRWMLDAAPPEGTVAVIADVDRLIQAMVNLATNAVQQTRDGDEIGIGAQHLGNEYELWVRDTGPGIAPTVLDTLFHRYERSSTSRSARPDGVGIGLSIVTAIATAHGGSLDARNVPGSGALFTISAPDEATEPDRPDARDHRVGPRPDRGGTS